MADGLGDLDLGEELTWEPLHIASPNPWTGHIPFAFWLVKAARPRTLVELGTHSGNSYFAFCQAVAAFVPSGRAYAVDSWAGDEHAGYYSEEVFAEVSRVNHTYFQGFSTLLRSSFDDARTYFPSSESGAGLQSGVDLLHIDGLHTYDAVKHDFETWRSALSPRAVVLFHDINVRERGFGVWRLWQELAEQYPSFAFDHSNGLGVLGVGAEQPPLMQALFSMAGDMERAGACRRRFAARGEAFQHRVEILELKAHIAKVERDFTDFQGHVAALKAQTDAELAAGEARIAQALAKAAADEAAASVASEARMAEALARAAADRVGAAAQAAGLQDDLSWRAALVDTQRDVIASKQATIETLAEIVEARSAMLDLRDQMLDQRDGTAADLIRQMEHQQFLVREERRVRDEMQAGYEAAIAGINADRDMLRGAMLQEWQETATSTALLYVNSTSWKITRPLRAGLRLLKGRRPHSAGLILPPRPKPPLLPSEQPPEQVQAEAPAQSVQETALQLARRTTRDLLRARLEAFLASTETLRLPSSPQPEVSIVLVLYNQAELTLACLASIVETLSSAPFGVEVLIADNASTDKTHALLDRIEGAIVTRNRANLHFLKAVNLTAAKARGRTLLLLNNDAQLLPGSLHSALRTLDSDHAIGAVGGRIILPDGTLQEAGSIIWQDGTCSGYARGEDPTTPDVMFQRDVDYCSGAFLLTPAARFHALGGFDERFAPAYYEETDYCVRLWEGGHRVVYDPDAAIVHFEFGSAGSSAEALRLQAANHAIFVAAHADWLSGQFPPSPLNILPARTARSAAPRILVIEDRVPKIELGTGYPRANRMLHEMLDAGAQVTLFPMYRHVEDWHGVRRALDKRIEVLIHADSAQLRDYLVARQRHFDAIVICRPPNMEAFLAAIGPERHLLGGAAVLYDAEALFATRTLLRLEAEGQTFSAAERHRLIAAEVSLTRTADAVISVAPAEGDVLEAYGVREVHLLGHALDDTPLPTGFDARDQIVFLGAIQEDNAPNADAVAWFASGIVPRLRQMLSDDAFRLTVIGRVGAPRILAMDGAALDLKGMVADLAPALARARVMVVPTRFAAGIPHKAHQAAALGIPMVVTTLIAGQLGWQDGVEVLVADEPADFAAACARLYTDPVLWARLRDAALARVQQDCAPEVFSRKIQTIVRGLNLVRRSPDPPALPLRAEPAPPADGEPPTSRPAAGDWSAAVPFGFVPQPGTMRLAAICHVFHVGVASELRFYLRKLPGDVDLFISTDTQEKQAALEGTFADWPAGRVTIRVTPNRGRDIAPKLIAFADIYDDYDLVLHLHSKISPHAHFLSPWRSYLFETLLGSPEIARSIIEAFARLPDLGMVAPQHYEGIRRWLGWHGNFEAARVLATRMGMSLSQRRALDFPSGSMFWARPAALRPLLDLKLRFEDFPEEGAQVDHTPAHAIERLYFQVCEHSGHSWMKVANPALCHDTSCIAELNTPADLSRFMTEHGVALSGPANIAIRDQPAPMLTRVAPGLAKRLAARCF
jgi:GT2 family glycosyltransferase/glycosyltransferase involved in cell wall biosynthesis